MSSSFSFTEDPVAIGAFHALEKGILTITAAKNFGPTRVINISRRLLTVAASTIDRRFVSQLALGNGKVFMVSSKTESSRMFHLQNFCDPKLTSS